MEKLYNRIDFHNGTTPALNDSNLNAISKAVDDIDNRICTIAADIILEAPAIREAVVETQRLAEEIDELAVSVVPSAERAEAAAERAEEAAKHAATTEVIVSPVLTSGTTIAEISVNGDVTRIYAPAGGGGTASYNDLIEDTLPKLNGVMLKGDVGLEALGIASSAALADLARQVSDANTIIEEAL